MRSLRDLTQHLTTRADDSHAAPVSRFPKAPIHLQVSSMSRPGGSLRCIELKPYAPPLVRVPSIHLSFSLANAPGGLLIALAAPLKPQRPQRPVDIVYGMDYQVI